jgi:hypothetical protein
LVTFWVVFSSFGISEKAKKEPSKSSKLEVSKEEKKGEKQTLKEQEKKLKKQERKPQNYILQLRDIEQRINRLKESILRSKARLNLLAEAILETPGLVHSRAVIKHKNELGSAFRMIKAVYGLDGGPIFNRLDERGSLSKRKQIKLYDGLIVPGEHILSVKIELRGHGYGIFSYLKGYKFKVSSSHTFNAPEGKTITLTVVIYEKGSITTDLRERPAVRYISKITPGVTRRKKK